MTMLHTGRRAAVALGCALLAAPAAFAETNSGDTAWVLTAIGMARDVVGNLRTAHRHSTTTA